MSVLSRQERSSIKHLKLQRNLKKKKGIKVKVLNLHTIKPLDEESVVALAKECKAIVTVEEHQIAGGMGSAVSECLAKHYPVPMEFIGVHDVLVSPEYQKNSSATTEWIQKILRKQ
jgi:transketolase C-terminal domain/subunit